MFFGERLSLALLPPYDVVAFRAGGVLYRDAGAGDFTATYDRLLDAAGRLAGILLCCVPEAAGLARTLAALPPAARPYLRRLGGQPEFYEVLFRDDVPEEEVESGGEQAFGGRIYRSEDGGVAVTVDLGYLLGGPDEEADLAALRAAAADWVVVTDLAEPGVE